MSVVFACIILKEKITVFSVVGLIVIVIGIFVQLKDK